MNQMYTKEPIRQPKTKKEILVEGKIILKFIFDMINNDVLKLKTRQDQINYLIKKRDFYKKNDFDQFDNIEKWKYYEAAIDLFKNFIKKENLKKI